MYSLPNIVSVYFGGVLVDIFGLTAYTLCCFFFVISSCRAGLVFSVLIAVGNWLVFLGPALFSRPFWLMAIGRFTYGIGAESLVIVQSGVLVQQLLGAATKLNSHL